jgi:hypothetical protein
MGPFVLVVDDENKVQSRSIQLGAQYGTMMVIEEGIEPDDRVIIEGLQQARPDSEVDPTETTLEPVKDELLEMRGEAADRTGQAAEESAAEPETQSPEDASDDSESRDAAEAESSDATASAQG